MAKIYTVEDDPGVLEGVKQFLELQQHVVEACSDGAEALSHLKIYPYDLVILDWNLPGMDGPDICRNLRNSGIAVPVLMLTARATAVEKEKGLDVGADDYLTKPFELRELGARVRALLRRGTAQTGSKLALRGVELDLIGFKAALNGEVVDLLPKEFQLLEFLMRNADHVFESEDLLNRVWPADSEATTEALKSTMKRMRRKIDPDGLLIENIRGVGYVFRSK